MASLQSFTLREGMVTSRVDFPNFFGPSSSTLRHINGEAIPIRLKGIHFININPILEAIISICKPFLHKEIYEMIYCQQTLEDFSKYIPLNILPMDYGGKDYAIEKIQSNDGPNILVTQ
ncbi:hypothetical protein WA026_005206 [Henosepilachna vigintioctopunctata]|uniref:CRAL-TRIO domain-containing protein n=1 Tax=Henosepilachna vigintioctopunctata TaxID=420089 RepID=A0AAW1UU11_9CUCU